MAEKCDLCGNALDQGECPVCLGDACGFGQDPYPPPSFMEDTWEPAKTYDDAVAIFEYHVRALFTDPNVVSVAPQLLRDADGKGVPIIHVGLKEDKARSEIPATLLLCKKWDAGKPATTKAIEVVVYVEGEIRAF